jgi:hypothetical protein
MPQVGEAATDGDDDTSRFTTTVATVGSRAGTAGRCGPAPMSAIAARVNGIEHDTGSAAVIVSLIAPPATQPRSPIVGSSIDLSLFQGKGASP